MCVFLGGGGGGRAMSATIVHFLGLMRLLYVGLCSAFMDQMLDSALSWSI